MTLFFVSGSFVQTLQSGLVLSKGELQGLCCVSKWKE